MQVVEIQVDKYLMCIRCSGDATVTARAYTPRKKSYFRRNGRVGRSAGGITPTRGGKGVRVLADVLPGDRSGRGRPRFYISTKIPYAHGDRRKRPSLKRSIRDAGEGECAGSCLWRVRDGRGGLRGACRQHDSGARWRSAPPPLQPAMGQLRQKEQCDEYGRQTGNPDLPGHGQGIGIAVI